MIRERALGVLLVEFVYLFCVDYEIGLLFWYGANPEAMALVLFLNLLDFEELYAANCSFRIFAPLIDE